MALYQRGEYAAFEELYRRHAGRVYGYAKSHSRLPGEAEDTLQQAFLQLHRHRDRYEPTLPFLPWLFSITRNLLVDQARKRRPIPVEEQALHALADAAHAALPEAPVKLDEVLALLPVEQGRLLRERFEEGLSFEEIAARSGISAVSARKRFSRTMQSVRRLVVGSEVTP